MALSHFIESTRQALGDVGPAPAAGAPPAPIAHRLPFTLQKPKETEWCWAAVAASVDAFYTAGTGRSQCAVAKTVLGQACCSQASSDACNRTASLDDALAAVGHFTQRVDAPIPMEADGGSWSLRGELDANRPVACRVEWEDATGHFVVIYGYRVVGGADMVDVTDPDLGNQTYPLAQFTTAYRSGTAVWRNTYPTL